jgi:hypothetical protein
MTIKVIDSFSFFNEVELLKLRLNYLNDVVDYFVISEGKYTHSGKSKPYYLDEVLPEIDEDIKKKIIRIKYEPDITNFNFPTNINECDFGSGYWELERSQRNLITESLTQFSLTDMFMISDLDEIPRKEIVKEYKEIFENYVGTKLPSDFRTTCKCEMFYYNFSTFQSPDWPGTAFCSVNTALKNSCIGIYFDRCSYSVIEDGGFHFSTFGDANRIRTKIQSFAHQEMNKKEYVNESNILKSIQNKTDLYHISGNFKNYDFSKFPKDLKKYIVEFFPEEMYL